MLGAAGMAACVGQWQTKFLRPDSTVSASVWSYFGAGVTDHYMAVDEVSQDGDTTYADYTVAKGSQTNALTFGFADPEYPVVTEQPVTFRMYAKLVATAGDNFGHWDFRLLESGVERDSWSTPDQDDTEGYVEWTRTFSQAVVDSINDWDNVRIESKFTLDAGSAALECDIRVTWMEIEVHG